MNNERLVRTAFETIWNRGEVSRVREFYAEGFRAHYPPYHYPPEGPSWGEGPDGVAHFVTLVRTAFPDYHETIEELISSGDRVVARMTNRGTHKGPLPNAPASGKSFEIVDIAICRIERGKIAEQWGLADQFTLLLQLGLTDELRPKTATQGADDDP